MEIDPAIPWTDVSSFTATSPRGRRRAILTLPLSAQPEGGATRPRRRARQPLLLPKLLPPRYRSRAVLCVRRILRGSSWTAAPRETPHPPEPRGRTQYWFEFQQSSTPREPGPCARSP